MLTLDAIKKKKLDELSAIFVFPSTTQEIISDLEIRRSLRRCTIPIVMIDSSDLVISQLTDVHNSDYGEYCKENGDIQYSYNIDKEDGTGNHYYNTTLDSKKEGYDKLTKLLIHFHNLD